MSSGTIVEAALLEIPSIGLCPTLLKSGILSDAFQPADEKGLLVKCPLKKDIIIGAIKSCSLRFNFKNDKVKENLYPSAHSVLREYCNDKSH